MNPLHRTRILLTLGALGLFVLGGATGSLLTLGIAKKRLNERLRATPEQQASLWLEKWDRQLHLTAEQKQQFKPVIEGTMQDLQRIRRRSLWATRQIVQKAEEALLPQLTSDQRDSYEKLQARRQEKLRQWGQPSGDSLPAGESAE